MTSANATSFPATVPGLGQGCHGDPLVPGQGYSCRHLQRDQHCDGGDAETQPEDAHQARASLRGEAVTRDRHHQRGERELSAEPHYRTHHVQEAHDRPQVEHLERPEDAVGTAGTVDHGVVGEGVVAGLRQDELDEPCLAWGQI
jgi:hypothetical protein